MKKCFVDDSSSFSVKNFAGISFVSGILGQTWHHTQISQCSTGATIYAYALDEDWYSQAYAGGIIGSVCRANNYSNAIAQIINCNNYGTIFADSLYSSEHSGGLIAHGAKCQIQFSINIGTVKSGALVDDVYYTAVTDLLISEKVPNGVSSQTESSVSSGSNTHTTSSTVNITDKIQHTTRIVSVANKVNLKYEECSNEIENALVHAISNIFAR
jgi:hypothetical protein